MGRRVASLGRSIPFGQYTTTREAAPLQARISSSALAAVDLLDRKTQAQPAGLPDDHVAGTAIAKSGGDLSCCPIWPKLAQQILARLRQPEIVHGARPCR